MDPTVILAPIASGLISALVGLGTGLVALKILGKRVKPMIQAQISAIPDLLIQEVAQNPEKYTPIIAQIRLRLEQEAIAYVQAFLKALHDHPEHFSPIINGLMGDLTKMFPQMAKGASVLENLPEGSIQAVLPFVPSKWRGPLMIAQMFFGGNNSGSGKEEKKNPFG